MRGTCGGPCKAKVAIALHFALMSQMSTSPASTAYRTAPTETT
ncbi:MAG: hypothetical protein RIR10_1277, partial [Planctomycetota bacterium]